MTLDEGKALDAAMAAYLRECRTTSQADVDRVSEDHPALLRYETHTGPSAPAGSAH